MPESDAGEQYRDGRRAGSRFRSAQKARVGRSRRSVRTVKPQRFASSPTFNNIETSFVLHACEKARPSRRVRVKRFIAARRRHDASGDAGKFSLSCYNSRDASCKPPSGPSPYRAATGLAPALPLPSHRSGTRFAAPHRPCAPAWQDLHFAMPAPLPKGPRRSCPSPPLGDPPPPCPRPHPKHPCRPTPDAAAFCNRQARRQRAIARVI